VTPEIDTTNLEWVGVESSNIEMLAWKDEMLYVMFHNGAVYVYSGVPYDVYGALLDAESHGEYLAQKIKPVYPFFKVTLLDGDE